MIIHDEKNYSLNKMHWFFILVFMVIAPISQFSSGYFPWDYSISDEYITKANNIIILWIVIYSTSYAFSGKILFKTSYSHNSYKKDKEPLDCNNQTQWFLVLISIISTIIMIRLAGFRNLFIRGTTILSDSTFGIMIVFLLRSIPPISALILLQEKKKSKNIHIPIILILIILTIILNSPVALSRYWSGTVYIGLLIGLMPRKVFDSRRFDILVLISLIIVFPIFRLFKYYTLSDVLQMNNIYNLFESYNTSDFDAYSMLCRIIEYVDAYDFQYGKQLRSVIFFFIPRDIWNIKGTPTGHLVSYTQNASYTNLSAPLMGEGFIDFGIIGVIMYAGIFAYVLNKFDNSYWNLFYEKDNYYIHIILPFMLGFVIFIMRGALQPVFLRVMGFFLFLMIYYFLNRNLSKFKLTIS